MVGGGKGVSNGQSVTTWIGLLRGGDHEAAERLWERYFQRLVTFARGKLHGVSRRAADEEDVAISAFHSFCKAAERFPRLNNRDDLWQILVMLTARKAYAERRQQQALKRGADADEPRTPVAEAVELDQIIGDEPTPEFAASVAEQFEALLARLPDAELRQIARLRLEEYTVEEIAARLGVADRTVRRKLLLIRSYWENEGPA
jgi:RNA polymerase sigma factor (sigma-70 family)